MKTLTIHVDACDTVFDIPGVKYDCHCPNWRGRRYWRVFPHRTTELMNRADCVLHDVLEQGVTEIKIISMYPPRPAEPALGTNGSSNGLAGTLYDAILKKLSNRPEGAANYRVCLLDVQNERGQPIYPARPGAWPYGAVSIGRSTRRPWSSPDAADAAALTFAWRQAYPRIVDLWAPKVELKDFEKLEKRVASLEFSARQRDFKEAVQAPYEPARYRKNSPSYFLDMYGSDPRTVDMYRFGDDSKLLINRWMGYDKPTDTFTGPVLFQDTFDGPWGPKWNFGAADSWKIETSKKPDYRKMVLRIHESGIAGLCLPATAPHAGRASEGRGYFLEEVPALAKKLRELKVRELTLRRKHSGVKMERMTEWLTAIVNASSPVMKIISDPEPLK